MNILVDNDRVMKTIRKVGWLVFGLVICATRLGLLLGFIICVPFDLVLHEWKDAVWHVLAAIAVFPGITEEIDKHLT